MDKRLLTQHTKIAGEMLRNLRDQAGFNQRQFAKRIGSHQSAVSKYENGERDIGIAELRLICHELGTSFHEFVKAFDARLPPAGSGNSD